MPRGGASSQRAWGRSTGILKNDPQAVSIPDTWAAFRLPTYGAGDRDGLQAAGEEQIQTRTKNIMASCDSKAPHEPLFRDNSCKRLELDFSGQKKGFANLSESRLLGTQV